MSLELLGVPYTVFEITALACARSHRVNSVPSRREAIRFQLNL